jgi:hypothetical protein
MDAARLMTLHAAWRMDRYGQQAARKEIGMIKNFGAQVLYNVIDRAIQTCGGLGYSGDLPLESMYRHARAARIYDGADEVHRQSLAGFVLKDYGFVLKDYKKPDLIYPTDHIPTRQKQLWRSLHIWSKSLRPTPESMRMQTQVWGGSICCVIGGIEQNPQCTLGRIRSRTYVRPPDLT